MSFILLHTQEHVLAIHNRDEGEVLRAQTMACRLYIDATWLLQGEALPILDY